MGITDSSPRGDRATGPKALGEREDNQQPFSVSHWAEEDLSHLDRNSGVSSVTTRIYEPAVKRIYKNSNRATREDFIDQSQEEGSLWASSGQTNYFFSKNKVRNPGDLISIMIEEDLYRDVSNEIKHALTPVEKMKEIERLQDQLRTQFYAKQKAAQNSIPPGASSVSEVQPSPSPSPGLDASEIQLNPAFQPSLSEEEIQKILPRATLSDVNLGLSLELKAGDKMMGEVIERFPNGNCKIKAVKKVIYKKGLSKVVTLTGVVKSADINDETDSIGSGKIYEYRIDVSNSPG
jgi:flagellar basal body L-ring protein FlgH